MMKLHDCRPDGEKRLGEHIAELKRQVKGRDDIIVRLERDLKAKEELYKEVEEKVGMKEQAYYSVEGKFLIHLLGSGKNDLHSLRFYIFEFRILFCF